MNAKPNPKRGDKWQHLGHMITMEVTSLAHGYVELSLPDGDEVLSWNGPIDIFFKKWILVEKAS